MTTPNEELRKLADTYADCALRVATGQTDRPEAIAVEARAALTNALQSQAERIKALERESEMRRITLHEAMLEADTLRVQLTDAELHTKQVERGLDKATAQLAEIEKTEPVAWLYTAHDGSVQAFTNEPPQRVKELCKPVFNRAISPVRREPMSDGALIDAVANSIAEATHPMPAQGVEASMINLPEPVELNPAANSVMGHSDATLKQAVRDALDEAMQACKQLEIAIDGGGNTYYRPADARQCVSAIETLKGK